MRIAGILDYGNIELYAMHIYIYTSEFDKFLKNSPLTSAFVRSSGGLLNQLRIRIYRRMLCTASNVRHQMCTYTSSG